jgi:hypothetical protein
MGKTIQLIHWKAEEARDRISLLESKGYRVLFEIPRSGAFLKKLRESPPDAVVIDLSRLPGQGRDFALAIRKSKATRTVPLVLAGGKPEKVELIRQLLPDATYVSWDRIQDSLQDAIASPPENPVVPDSLLAGYSGTPLAKKLGIKAHATIGLIDAPPDFQSILKDLPDGVHFSKQAREYCSLILWFVRKRSDLESRITAMVERTDYRSLWIIWPKKTSDFKSDLSQQNVREAGLSSGLVDYKVCAVDHTWSGLLFTHRK